MNESKTMFLMEINPLTVGDASINVFFDHIARALHDPSFLRHRTLHHDTSYKDDSDVNMEDDGFEVGKLASELINFSKFMNSNVFFEHFQIDQPALNGKEMDVDQSRNSNHHVIHIFQPNRRSAKQTKIPILMFLNIHLNLCNLKCFKFLF
jgi:hypothetical protein